MERHVLSILVENQAGVLSRITGLFSRRSFNIESLSCGVTWEEGFTRITIVTMADELSIKQIMKQLEKLVDVTEIIELASEDSVCRELALIKIAAEPSKRMEVVGIADIFRANIIDVSNCSITAELTGDQAKIEAFTELCAPYGIMEIVRTGLAALQRGAAGIKDRED